MHFLLRNFYRIEVTEPFRVHKLKKKNLKNNKIKTINFNKFVEIIRRSQKVVFMWKFDTFCNIENKKGRSHGWQKEFLAGGAQNIR